MYHVISLRGQLNKGQPCVLLLGRFDGVHIGHKRLFEQAKSHGLPVGVMFIIGGKGKSLFTISERVELYKQLGADFVLQMRFADIQTLSPKQFLDNLLNEFSVKAFICGTDFRFGYQALGDVKFLKEYTQGRVEIQNLVELDGEKIATTAIKRAIEQGDIPTANSLLASPYILQGEVQKDRGIGKTIGFPTANICYPIDKLPLKQGVYHTQVAINGQTYQAITNYGARPTFDNDSVVTETHVIGFQGDLYGQTLQIQFLRYLRDVQKFDSAAALQNQLRQDVDRAQKG